MREEENTESAILWINELYEGAKKSGIECVPVYETILKSLRAEPASDTPGDEELNEALVSADALLDDIVNDGWPDGDTIKGLVESRFIIHAALKAALTPQPIQSAGDVGFSVRDKMKRLTEIARNTLDKNKETLIAKFIEAHPNVALEDIRLIQELKDNSVIFRIEAINLLRTESKT